MGFSPSSVILTRIADFLYFETPTRSGWDDVSRALIAAGALLLISAGFLTHF
jgi:hypothetical protein